jgi:hypothetical protein
MNFLLSVDVMIILYIFYEQRKIHLSDPRYPPVIEEFKEKQSYFNTELVEELTEVNVIIQRCGEESFYNSWIGEILKEED